MEDGPLQHEPSRCGSYCLKPDDTFGNRAETPPSKSCAPTKALAGYLIQTVWLAHGALDVQAPHILPILLQQRDQEVDSHLHIDKELLLAESHIAHGNAQAQHLLQLELDAGLDLIHLPMKTPTRLRMKNPEPTLSV